MHHKRIALLFIVVVLGFNIVKPVLAQDNTDTNINSEPIDGSQNIPADAYYTAQVTQIVDETQGPPGSGQTIQTINVKILDGDEKGQEVTIQSVGEVDLNGGQKFRVGQKLVIDKTTTDGQAQYFVSDNYRLPAIWWIVGIFVLAAIGLGRLRGFTSILGLAISILVIAKFIVPRILAGSNPLLIILSGALIIAFVSLYLAHGFNKRTSIALLGTVLILILSVGLSYLFVHATQLFGNGSEEAVYLQITPGQNINLQGLLLGGIILGALGVLDDITTGQAAAVDEIHKANPALKRKELYKRGLSVGHEHIASLINTLALAYVGASLPLFLLFSQNHAAPFWTLINSEAVAEEIVRTLVGSVVLILAVPVSTYFTAYFLSKEKIDPNAPAEPRYIGHGH